MYGIVIIHTDLRVEVKVGGLTEVGIPSDWL